MQPGGGERDQKEGGNGSIPQQMNQSTGNKDPNTRQRSPSLPSLPPSLPPHRINPHKNPERAITMRIPIKQTWRFFEGFFEGFLTGFFGDSLGHYYYRLRGIDGGGIALAILSIADDSCLTRVIDGVAATTAAALTPHLMNRIPSTILQRSLADP